jgi:hypothetical protein
MQADLQLYNATLDCKKYWPRINCPLLFLGATNDFNSPMELVLRGFRSLPQKNGALSFTPHMNHRFTADNYAARVRWFESHLKGTFDFPKMSPATLKLGFEDGIPRFQVRPDVSTSHALESVTVFYGYDRDPRARFWRAAEVTREGDTFTALCPVMDLHEPLFAFANITYDTGETRNLPRGYNPTSLLTLTSECRAAFPKQLTDAGTKPQGDRQRLIEDFSRGWQDWSLVSANNHHHWNFETHKLNDPAFAGPHGAALVIDLETTASNNTLAVVMDVDRWRGYTGRKPRRFVALPALAEPGKHTVELRAQDFVTEEGEVLTTYDFVTSLIVTPGQKEQPGRIKQPWQGDVPTFKKIRWEGGTFAKRPRTYLKSGTAEIDADAAFTDQFNHAVDQSVERESLDQKQRD